MTELEPILDAYTQLTGRQAKMSVYEFSLFDYVRAGFTAEDMATVIAFIIRENKRNSFQYSLKLGHLINDHMRFNDLLEEAKARERNRIKPSTPRQTVLNQLRPVVSEPVTNTGTAMTVKDILRKVIQ